MLLKASSTNSNESQSHLIRIKPVIARAVSFHFISILLEDQASAQACLQEASNLKHDNTKYYKLKGKTQKEISKGTKLRS